MLRESDVMFGASAEAVPLDAPPLPPPLAIPKYLEKTEDFLFCVALGASALGDCDGVVLIFFLSLCFSFLFFFPQFQRLGNGTKRGRVVQEKKRRLCLVSWVLKKKEKGNLWRTLLDEKRVACCGQRRKDEMLRQIKGMLREQKRRSPIKKREKRKESFSW